MLSSVWALAATDTHDHNACAFTTRAKASQCLRVCYQWSVCNMFLWILPGKKNITVERSRKHQMQTGHICLPNCMLSAEHVQASCAKLRCIDQQQLSAILSDGREVESHTLDSESEAIIHIYCSLCISPVWHHAAHQSSQGRVALLQERKEADKEKAKAEKEQQRLAKEAEKEQQRLAKEAEKERIK